jgi:hypothetical protein
MREKSDPEDTVAALRQLLEAVERGTLESAALRVRWADGTEQEFVLGETEEERAQAMASLRRALGELH